MESYVPDTPLAPRRCSRERNHTESYGPGLDVLVPESRASSEAPKKGCARFRRLELDMAERSPTVDANHHGDFGRPQQSNENPSLSKPSGNYFTALQRKFQTRSCENRVGYLTAAQAARSPRATSPFAFGGTENQNASTQQSNDSQTNHRQEGYQSIQDAIAEKFQGLEKKIEAQEQEMTVLRFALNDAQIAADAFDAEKRQLKQKNDDLERQLRRNGDNTSRLNDKLQHCQDVLTQAADEQKQLRETMSTALEQSRHDRTALVDAQNAIKDAHAKLAAAQSELRSGLAVAAEQNNAHAKNLQRKITDLTTELQHREADIRFQKEANNRLSQQLESIPERNFQALSACVKKLVEELDGSKVGILTHAKDVAEQHQNNLQVVNNNLQELSTIGKEQIGACASLEESTKTFLSGLFEKLDAFENERQKSEHCSRTEIQSSIQSLQKDFAARQADVLKNVQEEILEKGILADLCQQREKDCKDISKKLSHQVQLAQEQLQQILSLHTRLQKMEDQPREDPETVAALQTLRDENGKLEAGITKKEQELVKLEERYKEKCDALILAGGRFAERVQQLETSYQQREDEYRRMLDQTCDLAKREAARKVDDSRMETTRELQQERVKRQDLEKNLRQTKEALSVMEESNRRNLASVELLQKELSAAKLGNHTIAGHLDEKQSRLEQERIRDASVITQLRAALADRERDCANLASDIKTYEDKVKTLVNTLEAWAQEYGHFGPVRTRLEMLRQVNSSCAASEARIKEIEQIDGVLTELRQVCTHSKDRGQKTEPQRRSHELQTTLLDSDQAHEERVSDLSAFLERDVRRSGVQAGGRSCEEAALDTAAEEGQASLPRLRSPEATFSVKKYAILETPASGSAKPDSATNPPAVIRGKTRPASLEESSSPGPPSSLLISSTMPKRVRLESIAMGAKDTPETSSRYPGRSATVETSRRRSKRRLAAVNAGSAQLDGTAPQRKRSHTESSVYFGNPLRPLRLFESSPEQAAIRQEVVDAQSRVELSTPPSIPIKSEYT
ncbi:hypothetical protein SPI_05103 [Niveomyces insectorum RCEF 264]|uniref:Uncharacterized protein n=1 Tax=Niveomyces insectorum RCEF 264 TaxID=1081102 RepID=A0A167TYH7_9HYPO|nr:hypothetical protein SPI_05103 [Niveomyces insectorum RCEF 264]